MKSWECQVVDRLLRAADSRHLLGLHCPRAGKPPCIVAKLFVSPESTILPFHNAIAINTFSCSLRGPYLLMDLQAIPKAVISEYADE